MQQDTALIRNFKLLPQASLAQLKQSLGLKMSVPELVFCAKHYNSRPTGEISIEALRFIDALACPAHTEPCKVAVGEMLTDREDYAQSFADALAKLKELGKEPEKPFTLQDFADLPARYLAALRDNACAEPVGIGGSDASYAARGLATLTRVESPVGHFDLLQELISGLDTHAAYADTLLLLSPSEEMNAQAFDAAVIPLLRGSEAHAQIHCICDCSTQSIAHAVLRISNGAVINLARLPAPLQSTLALTECHAGLLLALPQEAAWKLQEEAAVYNLSACCFGVADHAGYLIIRHQKDTLLSLDQPYLKSICFIRSYTLRLDDTTQTDDRIHPIDLPLRAPAEALAEQEPAEQLLLRTLPPLRTRNAVYAKATSYHTSIRCAVKAYCTAVAAGSDPRCISLTVRLEQSGPRSAASSAMLSALLGLHRFAMELGVPLHTDAALDCANVGTTVLASAPSDMIIPSTLQGGGRIYLLQPTCDADGLPDFGQLRALISYLRRAITDGKIKSARAFAGITASDALAAMANGRVSVIPNPHTALSASNICPCAFLVEAEDVIEGDLIALSTPENLANSL